MVEFSKCDESPQLSVDSESTPKQEPLEFLRVKKQKDSGQIIKPLPNVTDL